jgi:hypothetical protein
MNLISSYGNWAPCCVLLLFAWSLPPIQAEQFGLFTYEIIDDSAVITDYPDTEVGHVEIPSEIEGLTVVRIADLAFDNVRGLTSVTIPASVTTIGNRAFYRNDLLLIAHLLGDPPALDSKAFSGGDRGFALYVPSTKPVYTTPTWEGYPTVHGGTLGPLPYRIVEDSVEIFRCHANHVINVTVPPMIEGKPVTSIAHGAFAYQKELSTVTLPDSIRSISAMVFRGCQNLRSINLPDALTTIASETFYGCSALTELVIPGGIESIGQLAFSHCSALESLTLSSGITNIGNSTFANCDALLSVKIPSTVTSLGRGTFAGCSALTTIEVDEENSQFLSLDGVLFNADQTILIQCPAARKGSYAIPSTATRLASRAFFDCRELTFIHIPLSVTFIGEFTFHSCQGLTSLALPSSLTTIYDGAFISCDRLTSVSIPPNVNYIGKSAFKYCSNLQSLIFMGNDPHFSEYSCSGCAPTFTTYHIKNAFGFSVPIWAGYPSVEIDLETHPAAPWLLSHGFQHDIDLDNEPNGGGATLLEAYALDLDPRLPLLPQFPKAILKPNTLGISFYGIRPRITYLVESSDSLKNWETEGVTISNPDSKGIRTATINRLSSARFLRLTILQPQTKSPLFVASSTTKPSKLEVER